MLYLDKCWSYLQDLFSGRIDEPSRAAHALVAGKVEMHGMAWNAVVAARRPRQVAEIAHDIPSFGESDVRELFTDERRLRYGGSLEQEVEYLMQ